MAQDAKCVNKLDFLTLINTIFSFALKCGEWAHLFATNVAKEKILFEIADLDAIFWDGGAKAQNCLAVALQLNYY
jgi:hypothetical protein